MQPCEQVGVYGYRMYGTGVHVRCWKHVPSHCVQGRAARHSIKVRSARSDQGRPHHRQEGGQVHHTVVPYGCRPEKFLFYSCLHRGCVLTPQVRQRAAQAH